MSPTFELYTWQEPAAIYNMVLDVEEIGKDRPNLVALPDPTLLSEMPDEVADFLRKPSRPDAQDQEPFILNEEHLAERLGASGTAPWKRSTQRTPRPTLVIPGNQFTSMTLLCDNFDPETAFAEIAFTSSCRRSLMR
jgi:hypothetical protein